MPIEIKNQQFKKVMRGYDTVEVDTFIELIADKYAELLNENERLSKQVMIMESELANIKDVEKTLKETLKNVQENSQVSKANSAKEAGLIRKEAELAAAQLMEKTRLRVLKMKEELVTLQNQKHSFISRLRHVLASQMELLEVLKTDDLDLSQLDKGPKPLMNKKPMEKPIQNTPQASAPSAKPRSNPEDSTADKEPGKDLFNDIFGEKQEK
jgi:cell division initiation protein